MGPHLRLFFIRTAPSPASAIPTFREQVQATCTTSLSCRSPALQRGRSAAGHLLKFSHDEESAYAGYYQVRLKDYHINVELTATERCGIQRYTFPKSRSRHLPESEESHELGLHNDSHIEVVDSVTIQGYRYSDLGWARDQRIYFRTRFSKPFDKVELDTTAIIKDKQHIGTAVIARFDFHTEEGEQILVNTAISGVSMEGAAKNLQAEVPEMTSTSIWQKQKQTGTAN